MRRESLLALLASLAFGLVEGRYGWMPRTAAAGPFVLTSHPPLPSLQRRGGVFCELGLELYPLDKP